MSNELQDRITELEIRFSNRRIDRLGQQNQQLREMISSLSPAMEESPDE